VRDVVGVRVPVREACARAVERAGVFAAAVHGGVVGDRGFGMSHDDVAPGVRARAGGHARRVGRRARRVQERAVQGAQLQGAVGASDRHDAAGHAGHQMCLRGAPPLRIVLFWRDQRRCLQAGRAACVQAFVSHGVRGRRKLELEPRARQARAGGGQRETWTGHERVQAVAAVRLASVRGRSVRGRGGGIGRGRIGGRGVGRVHVGRRPCGIGRRRGGIPGRRLSRRGIRARARRVRREARVGRGVAIRTTARRQGRGQGADDRAGAGGGSHVAI
jgi:hypothetical protein